MHHRLTAMLIGLAILALSLPAPGNVFRRWRTDAVRSVADAAPNWRQVYRSNIRVNGGQGRLDIIKCEGSLSEVMARLKRAFPGARPDAAFRHGEAAGAGLVQTGDTVIRFLALELGAPGQTVLFAVTQTPADYERSLKPPAERLLRAAPVYPGSAATAFIADEEAAAELEISTANERPEAVLGFFDAAFAGLGYQRAPTADGRAGLAIFQKNTSLCCVLVQDGPAASEATITVLHKRFRME